MRHGGRFALCTVSLGFVLSATLWINSGKTIRAQPGDVPKGPVGKDAVPFAGEAEVPPLSPAPQLPAPSEPIRPVTADPALGAAVPPTSAPARAAPDDPEKAAESFVDQTKQQADAHIKDLTAEAEQLRARLKKVESAIERWRTLRSALEPKPAQVQAAALPGPGPVGLDPGPSPNRGPETTLPLPTRTESALELPLLDDPNGSERGKSNAPTPAPR